MLHDVLIVVAGGTVGVLIGVGLIVGVMAFIFSDWGP